MSPRERGEFGRRSRAIPGFLVTLLTSALPGHTGAQALPGYAGVQSHAAASDQPSANRPSSWIEGQGQPITIKGETVCLKHRNPVHTLECAIGFRGDDEKFYSLYAKEPRYWSGARFRIIGTLWPSLTDKYVEVGTIEVRETKRTDDPKGLVGEYVCLPEVAQTSPPSDCVPGIKTHGGFYWALYPVTAKLRGRLSKLAAGDRLAVKGVVVQGEEWSRLRRTFPGSEALRVISVNTGAPKAGS